MQCFGAYLVCVLLRGFVRGSFCGVVVEKKEGSMFVTVVTKKF